MNEKLATRLHSARNGYILTTTKKNGRICLEALGRPDEVRHCFNQMVCLIAGAAMEELRKPHYRAMGHSTSAPIGSWFDRFNGNMEFSSPSIIFSVAASEPSERADDIGYLALFDDWPYGMGRCLPGHKTMTKSMLELARVFFDFGNYPIVELKGSALHSAVMRGREALATAKRNGYEPYKEQALRNFFDTLTTACSLHFVHEVDGID